MPNEYQFSGINENNSLCQTLPVVLNNEKRISPVHFLPSPVNPGGHTHRNPPKVFWQIDLALQLCTFKLHSSKSKDQKQNRMNIEKMRLNIKIFCNVSTK